MDAGALDGIRVLEHDLTGPERMVGALVEMSERATRAVRAAPQLGCDTEEVLAEAGFNAEEIAALRPQPAERSAP